jgi:hypothetical protein
MAILNLDPKTATATDVLERIEAALRAIRVMQSAPSPELQGEDRELILTWKRRSIQRLEDLIEECVGVLDGITGDPDLEPEPEDPLSPPIPSALVH